MRTTYFGKFDFSDIDDVPMTATVTMPVADWRALREAMDGKRKFYGPLYDMLGELLSKAELNGVFVMTNTPGNEEAA